MQADSGNSSSDAVVQLGDLSLATLIALVDRLRATETPNQFLSREIELDEAYLQADAEARAVEEEGTRPEAAAQARLIRSLVISAHDLLGESNLSAAIDELHRVIEIKIGLSPPPER